jgi:thioredoxin 1
VNQSFRNFPGILAVIIAILLGLPASPARGQAPAAAPPPPALYDFGMGMCLSCKDMEKILESVKNRYGSQLEVRLVYVDREKDLFRQYKIIAVPTQVFLDAAGKEVDRHLGLFPEAELIKKLKDLKFIKD